MGNTSTTRLRNYLSGHSEMRILMNGLDGCGKTTMLYQMKLGEVVTAIPTMGFNVETIDIPSSNVSLTTWDCGGRSKSRPMWRHYLHNTQGLIWVVDSTDRDRLDNESFDPFDSSRAELHRSLAEPELSDAVLLVFANKQDISGCLSPAEISERLGLKELRNRPWLIQGCSAVKGKKGEGLWEGMEWLAETIKQQEKIKPRRPSPREPIGNDAAAAVVPIASSQLASADVKVATAMEAISSDDPNRVLRDPIPLSQRRPLAAAVPSAAAVAAADPSGPMKLFLPASSSSTPPTVVTKLMAPPLSSRRKLYAISSDRPDELAVQGVQPGWMPESSAQLQVNDKKMAAVMMIELTLASVTPFISILFALLSRFQLRMSV